MTETKKPTRARLTHAQYHQACVFLADAVKVDADALVLRIFEDCGLTLTAKQVREMCDYLGLSVNAGALAVDQASAMDAIRVQLAHLSEISGKHAIDIAKIKDVLNDHAKQLVAWGGK
jgi:hypothetical protein